MIEKKDVARYLLVGLITITLISILIVLKSPITGYAIYQGSEEDNSSDLKVEKEVLEEFETGEEKVGVIIELEDEKEINKNDSETLEILEELEVEDEETYKNYIYKEVNEEELEELKESVHVEEISMSFKIKGFLQDSVPQINASLTHPLKISNINLTGTEQTVCVLDSGIDFTHPDLIGKNKSCIVDCFDKVCIEDCALGDDNGHGTHVAGIVGASGGITGTSPNVSLIGVKVLDSNGDGSDNALDLSKAIDYCVAQKVSVITMSLGTSSLYDSNCNELVNAWTDAINNAFAQNISVVIATGNEGNYTHIAAPACISNATPVGSVRKDDLTIDYNRNSLLQLLGIGVSINSTKVGGGYVAYSGTSMATPHIAGAIAIINQALNLTTQTKTPAQIEELLNTTGKQVYDSSSSLYFSRPDIYNAIFSLDNIAPNITLNSPENNLFNLTQNQTFNCNYSDWQLSNVTLYLWNSTNPYYNETKDSKGNQNSSNFNITDLPYDNYKWNCLVYDEKSNSAFAENNFSLTIGGVSTLLISPENNAYPNNEINFTCNSSSTTYDLINVTFYLWNTTNLYYNETTEISGLNNQTIFNYTLTTETNYSWNCLSFNNQTNSSWANSNYTLTYNTTSLEPIPYTPPIVTSSSGSGGSTITSKTYPLTQEQITTGYVSKPLQKNDKIKFTFFDKETEEHILIINTINTNSIDLTIQSEPIKLKLGIGQSAKLNLTSPDYYDLYVKLNSIINGKAELVIQTINEKIPNQEIKITGSAIEEETEETPSNKGEENLTSKIQRLKTLVYILIIIILFIVIFLLTRWKDIEKPVFGGKDSKKSFLRHLLDIK